MYKDADGRLYTREELDSAPGNLLTKYIPPATGEALQAQLESLGAVIVRGVGDPYKTRYALPFEGYPDEGQGWFTFSHQAAATALLKAIEEGQEDFTSCLRAESVTTMPVWWTHDNNHVWRVFLPSWHEKGVTVSRYYGNEAFAKEAYEKWGHGLPPQRITADVGTGEEVAAPEAWRVGDETFATFHEAEDAAFSIVGVPFSPEPC